MNQLFTLSYWFTGYPNSSFNYTIITFVVSALIILAGLGIMMYRKKIKQSRHRSWMRSYSRRLINLGIVALFLLFFREVGIPYLSMRFLWVLWLIVVVIVSVVAFKQYKKATERAVTTVAKPKDPRAKYLPKKKKKR